MSNPECRMTKVGQASRLQQFATAKRLLHSPRPRAVCSLTPNRSLWSQHPRRVTRDWSASAHEKALWGRLFTRLFRRFGLVRAADGNAAVREARWRVPRDSDDLRVWDRATLSTVSSRRGSDLGNTP